MTQCCASICFIWDQVTASLWFNQQECINDSATYLVLHVMKLVINCSAT
jgi:hypothetical protein